MREIIENILDKYSDNFGIEYGAVFENNVSHIILLLPYSPFVDYPKNVIRIDAFYLASNKLYHIKNDIAKELQDKGIEIVKDNVLLKPMASKCGLGTILNNQLLANSKYGSKVTIQCITIREKYEKMQSQAVKKTCDTCHKCDDNCPQKALFNGVFTRDKCLRHIQDYPEIICENIENRFLGCEECQKICPHNSKIASVKMSDELIKILDISNIFDIVLGGKKTLKVFADLFGYNYAKPSYILRLLLNTLIITNNFDYVEKAKLLLNFPNNDVVELARKYILKCDKI